MGNLVGRSVIIKEICNGFGLGSLGRRGPKQTSAEFRCVLVQDNRILQRERVLFLLFRPLHPLLKERKARQRAQRKAQIWGRTLSSPSGPGRLIESQSFRASFANKAKDMGFHRSKPFLSLPKNKLQSSAQL
ncbi:hypothetical protein AOLI_G00015970 [Acnodon oligacanthus]